MSANLGILVLLTFVFHIFFFAHGDETYTADEKRAIVQLRELASDTLYLDFMKEDFTIVHFLRARNLNLNDAHNMLRQSTKWRKDNKIDTIQDETILPELFQPRLDGHDKIGRPIAYISPARWDVRKVILAGHAARLIRLWAKTLELVHIKILVARNSTGRDIGDSVVVLDFHGYNLRQHTCLRCFANYAEFIRIYENNYPHAMAHLYVINVPRIFQPLLEFARGLFSPHTHKILKVFNTKEEWQPELLKQIDSSELLQHYGGTKV